VKLKSAQWQSVCSGVRASGAVAQDSPPDRHGAPLWRLRDCSIVQLLGPLGTAERAFFNGDVLKTSASEVWLSQDSSERCAKVRSRETVCWRCFLVEVTGVLNDWPTVRSPFRDFNEDAN
jgi:hypothetical protein